MITVTVQETSDDSNVEWASTKKYILLSLIMIICLMPLVIMVLDASGYAGTIDDTQLGFNAEIIKYYFSLMSQEGMALFALGNLLDYAFILAYGIGFYHSTRYLSRNYATGGIPKKIGFAFTWIGVSAAIFDSIENAHLFLMLANPTGFPSWLAVAHSLFASIKFMMMYATFGWLVLSIILNWTLFRFKHM